MIRYSILLLGLLLLFIQPAVAQTDSLPVERKWYVPDHYKLHFAGEIGFLSPGAGYELFPKRNGELDVFGGFLPEFIGGDNVVTIATKFHYMPWKKKINRGRNDLEPLTLGAIVYHAFGEDLNKARDKDLYPQGYYWWTIGTRFGPFVGSRITRAYKDGAALKSITLYVEFGTNDLFLYSWAKNRTTIPLYKIWNSSVGLKWKF
jgi:hypothetical protein